MELRMHEKRLLWSSWSSCYEAADYLPEVPCQMPLDWLSSTDFQPKYRWVIPPPLLFIIELFFPLFFTPNHYRMIIQNLFIQILLLLFYFDHYWTTINQFLLTDFFLLLVLIICIKLAVWVWLVFLYAADFLGINWYVY